MRRWFLLVLALVLAISLLAGCGGKKSSETTADVSNDLIKGLVDASGLGSEEQRDDLKGFIDEYAGDLTSKDRPKTITAADVTVNPGDVVFENEYFTLVYNSVKIVDTSNYAPANMVTLECSGTSDSMLLLSMNTEPLLINGSTAVKTDSVARLNPQMRAALGTDTERVGIYVPLSALEEAGIAPADIKTMKVKIVVQNLLEEKLFEGSAIFNLD